jgi:hypothetical protein
MLSMALMETQPSTFVDRPTDRAGIAGTRLEKIDESPMLRVGLAGNPKAIQALYRTPQWCFCFTRCFCVRRLPGIATNAM